MIKPLFLSSWRISLQLADGCQRYFLKGLLLASLVCTTTFTLGQAALHFDGVNDYVDLGAGIPNVTTFTIEAWIKPSAGYGTITASSDPAEIVSRWGLGGAGNAAYRLGINSDGKLVGAVYDGTNGSTVTSTSVIPTNNVWLHVAFTRSVDNTMRLYINGVLDGTQTGSVAPQASNYPVYLGKPIDGANRYGGSIDEVRIWNRALLACEITNQRNCELPSGQTGLVAYYKFNQSTGTSLPDASSNNNTGTLNGFALSGETSNWVTLGGVTSGVSCAAPVVISASPSLSISAGNFITLTASGANSYVWSTGATSSTIIDSPTSTTVYSVTGTTTNGCSLASTIVTVASALMAGCNTYQTITTANGLGSNTVNKVVAVGNNVYAATSNGLSISTDGGKTFTNRTTANGLGHPSIFSLQVVGNTIYAGHNLGLAISTDGGQTFTNRPIVETGRRVTAVFAVGNTVYVGLNPNKFYKSTDGGQTFDGGITINTNVANGNSTITDIYATGNTIYLSTVKGFFVSTDAGASFSFRNVGTLNQPSMVVQGGTIYVGTTGGIVISTDGGQSFVRRTTSDGLASNGVRGLYAVGSRVYAATDGGLSISTDGGQTFTSHTINANGLAAAGITAVAVQGERVYAGTSAGLSIPGLRIRTALSGTSTTLVSSVITLAPGSSATVIGSEPNDTYNWSTGSTAKSIQVNTTGIYSLTTTGACPGSSTVSITVLQSTSAASLGTLTPGQCPATLSFFQEGQRIEVTGPGGYSFKNALAKPAVAGNRYPISLTGIRISGIYTVRTFNSSGTLLSVVEYPVLGGCN